mgnify:CR=1 FL=1
MVNDGVIDSAFVMDNCQGDFSKDGYCIIPNAVSKELCSFITQYARLKYKVAPNVYRSKDDSLANIHREYGDPLMETLLQRLHSPVEQVTGMQLWPSLSFYYTYTRGNVLKKHKDRDSCEVVACLCIGSDAEYAQAKKFWPIYLGLSDEDLPVCLHQGDLVLFKGKALDHWREAYEGEWFISSIFAFVEREGPNNYLKYDQRSYLAKPHIGMLRWSIGYFYAQIKRLLFTRHT